MKLFAMLMLRYAFVMLSSSLLRNGTKATLDELENWKKSCQELAVSIAQQEPIFLHHPKYINKMIMEPLTDLLDKVKKFPIEGMEEPLSRRLIKPLGIAIGNCEKILNEVEHSGQEDNKNYEKGLLSKINSIAKRIDKDFNLFIMEVELKLIEKVNWTSGNNIELTLLERLEELAERALKEAIPLKDIITKKLDELRMDKKLR